MIVIPVMGIGISRDEDFSRNWNSLQRQTCHACGDYFRHGSEYGNGKHAVLDRKVGGILVYCDDCFDKVMDREKKKETVGERHKVKVPAVSIGDTIKAKKKISDEEEEDDEEEDEDDDEFKGFFHSLAGKAISTMFKHIENRLSKLEKKYLRDT